MSDWTHKHDRIIAERCEGWQQGEYGDRWISPDGQEQSVLPNYNTDIAACFRAAEAWRRQEAGRHYRIYSACDGSKRTWIQAATLVEGSMATAGTGEGPSALAWALYEAVKNA